MKHWNKLYYLFPGTCITKTNDNVYIKFESDQLDKIFNYQFLASIVLWNSHHYLFLINCNINHSLTVSISKAFAEMFIINDSDRIILDTLTAHDSDRIIYDTLTALRYL